MDMIGPSRRKNRNKLTVIVPSINKICMINFFIITQNVRPKVISLSILILKL